MSKQQPTIGRIVVYRDEHECEFPAIVVYSYPDGEVVNLVVFGQDESKPAQVLDAVEQGTGRRQWSWPERG